MSTLCGRKYQEVEFDFPVSTQVLPAIRDLTFATIETRGEGTATDSTRSGTLLSFSGGFDSLAAKTLMPEDTNLVSMDFGGRFARERDFFERFDTLRVSTNLVETPLRSNSWSFMGIGAILAADHFGAEYHTFGGILEAGPDNMRLAPAAARSSTFPPFKAAGYTNAPYVLGLTEIGTLTVMLRDDPAMVAKSLPSVASPGEEKLYRKAVLAQLVADSLGVSVDWPEVKAPATPHFAFGQNFALDLLVLYVEAKGQDASRLVRDIPADVLAKVRGMGMAFMERANPTLFEHFPAPLAPALYQRLAEYGIGWYTEKDWGEFRQVRELLSAYHPVVAT